MYPFLATSTLHCNQLLPTPLLQTPHGHLTAFCLTFWRSPLIKTLVLFILTLMPLLSTLSFHSLSLLIGSSSVSAITAKSSAYSSSHGRATLNSLDMASMTIRRRCCCLCQWLGLLKNENGRLNFGGSSPPLTLKFLQVSLSYCVCSDAGVDLNLVSIHQSVCKNHGHAWMPSQSLVAVAESPSSYGRLRGSKDIAVVCVYYCSHFICIYERWTAASLVDIIVVCHIYVDVVCWWHC